MLQAFEIPKYNFIPDYVYNLPFTEWFMVYGGIVLVSNTLQRYAFLTLPPWCIREVDTLERSQRDADSSQGIQRPHYPLVRPPPLFRHLDPRPRLPLPPTHHSAPPSHSLCLLHRSDQRLFCRSNHCRAPDQEPGVPYV